MKTNRPSLNEIFSEEYWTKRESVMGKDGGPIIPWKEGFLFLLPVGGILGTPILLGLINIVGKTSNKFWSKLGIKCRKSYERNFDFYYSEVVFSLVMSLKKLNINLISAEDTGSGSIIVIKMPQDIRTFGGTVTFEIIEKGQNKTEIKGTSEVKGQLKDWGKGKDYKMKFLKGNGVKSTFDPCC